MAISDELSKKVQGIIGTTWNTRKGQVVPSTDSVALAGGAVELNATFLYADLANSSKMAKELDRRVAAKVLKSFHSTTCRLIRSCRGNIQSFDGDRVMGVFVGDYKNSNATRCALQINYAVDQIIRPKFENSYESVRDASFTISHGVGIDTGTVLTVRAGARGANDLIWIGRAPNLAAKLSDIRDSSYRTIITSAVYNVLTNASKYGGEDSQNMWVKEPWNFLEESLNVYCSSWWWKP